MDLYSGQSEFWKVNLREPLFVVHWLQAQVPSVSAASVPPCFLMLFGCLYFFVFLFLVAAFVQPGFEMSRRHMNKQVKHVRLIYVYFIDMCLWL